LFAKPGFLFGDWRGTGAKTLDGHEPRFLVDGVARPPLIIKIVADL
jgi:hypothetical protein